MRSHLLIPLAILLVPGLATAVPAPPPGFTSDTGAQLFDHTSTVLAVELFDNGESLPPAGGWSFGFYFASDPGTLITIFDSTDVAGTSSAVIDFDDGTVVDVDEGNLQDVFSASADPIGFWLDVVSDTFYTESALNAGAIDPAFTWQSLSDPMEYIIGFETPGGHLTFQLLTGLTAVVPEPGTLALLGAGMLLAGFSRRRR